MTGVLQPLDLNFRVVDERGFPTIYFTRWAQQRQIDISGSITAAQALEIVTQFLGENPLIAGLGIGLSPSGNIADGVTISAQVQAILDQISTTQGSVLFRGAADWQALAPGTSGHFLKTNGAAADPEWAAGGGGGGASWSLLQDTTIAAPTASIIQDVTAYQDFAVIARGVTLASSANRGVQVSVDGGATYFNTSSDYLNVSTSGTESGTYQLMGHATATTAARTFGGAMNGIQVNGGPKFASDLTGAVNNRLFIGSTSPITHIRVCGQTTSGGAVVNMTAGQVSIFGRS